VQQGCGSFTDLALFLGAIGLFVALWLLEVIVFPHLVFFEV
jgi:hypothetical protein